MRKRWKTSGNRLSALALVLLLMTACLVPAGLAAEQTTIAAGDNVVRVLLTKTQAAQQITLRTTGYYVEDRTGLTLEPNTTAAFTVVNGQLVLHGGGMTLPMGDQLMFRRRTAQGVAAGGLYLNGSEGRYEGDLQLQIVQGEIQPILHIGVEDYLIGVVPYEMSNSFPIEALKVQAIAARTYALRKRDASRAYDVTDNTNDQVYYGRIDSYENAIAAVEATRGISGYYKGKLAICYYSASNGGQTELVEHVWGDDGEDHGYVDMRNDPYDVENPRSLVKRFSIAKKPGEKGIGEALHAAVAAQISEEIEGRGYDSSEIRIDEVCAVRLGEPKFDAPSRHFTTMTMELRVSAKKEIRASQEGDDLLTAASTPQPTAEATAVPVKLSSFEPLAEPVEVTLPIFEAAEEAMGLSISFMKNELWTVTEQNDAFIVEARRYGHGVGMSQRGAEWMAGRYGKTYEEILSFYYPGMEFKRMETDSPTPQPLDGTYLATPAPTPAPTPRPTIMPMTLAPKEGEYIAEVTHIEDDSSLNLRMEPSMEADVRKRLLKGQRLLVEETLDGGWVKVRTDVTEGYVMAEYLEKVE